MKHIALYLILFLGVTFSARSQSYDAAEVFVVNDSLITSISDLQTFQTQSKLDPDKAGFYSAVFPGLGQMYNKQYWKLPFIYGGGIMIGHLIKYNNDHYNAFRNAYIAENDGNPETVNPFPGFNVSSLQRRAEKYKRDRDFMVIIGAVLYFLNIVDAHVSAHLIEFEINDDLSLRPSYLPRTEHTVQNMGMSLVLQLSK
ncbi:MAG: DUF5683 domain-containing protein [Reichenbachiella sp.]